MIEIVRAVTIAITEMESRFQSYHWDIMGDIGAKIEALTREKIRFCENYPLKGAETISLQLLAALKWICAQD